MTSWRLLWAATLPTDISWLPHGICLQWQWPLLLALVAGNLAIALAYTLIPLALLRCIRHLPSVLRPGSFLLRFFAAFIVSCGATHVMAILVIWYPCYHLEAAVDLWTAGISLYTAYLLWWLPIVIDEIREALSGV
ncbi:MAG: hypothetical protein JO166_02345 [Deltaproteobacteria bacterium]|nr:hypothetical protein [Deltaproteobacteria bacterium]